ncbi:Gfo/Idh/MocA family oxidoreductase [Candidatus Gottesmanbacteria bacterium]|nr:Gfo/Idh/MocA family oxidoreductase [Candidatus Gottesmanbacteria bacterium]
MKKVSVGVIGVGTMGVHHARNFAEIDGVTLVAIADTDVKRGQEVAAKYQCLYYKDYRKLLQDKTLSAVTIAVPTSLHFKIAKDCLNANKHVLVEKPITATSTQAKELIDEAKKRNLILGVGHVERFNPAVLELKKYLLRGEIGRIVSLLAKRVGLYPPSVLDTNVIVDLAIHDIDIFSFLLDQEPLNTFCLGGKAIGNKREDYAEILLSYKGSVHGLIQVNWITPVKIRQLSVTGTKGYIELDYINQKIKIYHSHYTKSFDSFGEFLVRFGTPDVIDINVTGEEPLKAQLTEFVDCIRKGRKFPVDGNIGLNALITAEKSLAKMRERNIL